jgi:GTP-binding protein EngB required for normal cell division
MTTRAGGAVATIATSVRRLLGRTPRIAAADGARLTDDLMALRDVVSAGDGRLDEHLLAQARAVLARAGERAELSGDHAVVALAGATGSGKSSLFNAITGLDLADVGARRPTTSTTLASVWGADGAGDLLDWLGIRRRHRIEHASALSGPRETELAGLVLLDMPDHDSTATSHQAEVDRLFDLVDLFVWVVDPQKYADLALYERYLDRLQAHRDVMIVVLNQIDLLSREEQKSCRDDLARLLDDRGLDGVPVLATSARTGEGVEELRTRLRDRITGKRVSADRLDADVLTVLGELADGAVGQRTPALPRSGVEELSAALYEAAGGPVVAAALDRSFRDASVTATGWPVTRWLRKRRPDPLRRLHLPTYRRRGTPAISSTTSSIAAADPVRRARSDRAVRELSAASAQGLPPAWQRGIADAAQASLADLPDALDQAVTATDLGTTRRPLWWRACNGLAWLFLAVTVVGGGWLLLLGVGSYLRLPDVPTPKIGELPVPTLLLAAGLAGSLLVSLLGRAAAVVGGRRRAAAARRRLSAAVSAVADDLVLAPIRLELERHERVRKALADRPT